MSSQQNLASESNSILRETLHEIRALKEEINHLESSAREPIAVIGMGCRFPGGANSPEAFWKMLREGESGIRDLPPDRWDIDACLDANPSAPGKMVTRRGGYLDTVDQFDPQFFGISPREAIHIDPQQRLLLEVTWETLADSGLIPGKLRGSDTGVFIGISTNDYDAWREQGAEAGYSSLGIAHSVAVGRIAYTFDFHGPVMEVDTACSSSLTAVHIACQQLRLRKCAMALAGGVNLILTPENSISLTKLGLLSPEGVCKTFDAGANGYVRSEGCGLVALKLLSNAQTDGDRILAVIRSSAINHDGHSNGLTAPNGRAQEALLRTALADANLQPADIQYIEAQGTATILGDLIETQALGAVFARDHQKPNLLKIGSVKTNIGHLEAAGGIAGLIKVILSLKHGFIPPHLHFHQPSSQIPWERLSLQVTATGCDWLPGALKRRAGISSFGFSGTNIHVILEESPQVVLPFQAPPLSVPQVLCLSARSRESLNSTARKLATDLALSQYPDGEIVADVVYTSQIGREHATHRLAVIADSRSQAQDALTNFTNNKSSDFWRDGKAENDAPRIAFLYTGQGAQYTEMGKSLFDQNPVFRDSIAKCDEILQPLLGRSLITLLYPSKAEQASASSDLNEAIFTQPALFAIEYALSQVWLSWGIKPYAVMGHSAGEYAAACIAGVFSLSDGLRLIAERGRLVQSLPKNGKMRVIFAPESQVSEVIQPFADVLSVAAINGPRQTVISGRAEEVELAAERFSALGIVNRALPSSHAFHSPLVDPVMNDLQTFAQGIKHSPTKLRLISNLSGGLVEKENTEPGYWARHLRAPVKFASGIAALRDLGCSIFLEVGPQAALLNLGRDCLPTNQKFHWVASLRKNKPNLQTIAAGLGSLYCAGVDIVWPAIQGGASRKLIALPAPAYDRQSLWNHTAALTFKMPPAIWAAVGKALDTTFQEKKAFLDDNEYDRRWRFLDRFCQAAIYQALQRVWQTHPKSKGDDPGWRTQLGAQQNQILIHWEVTAQQLGWLAGSNLESIKPPNEEFNQLLDAAKELWSDTPSLIDLVVRCAEQFDKVLLGKQNPLALIFPGGRDENFAALHISTPLANLFNMSIANAVKAAVESQTTPGVFRILEIGTATGGTTSWILTALPGGKYSYTFSNISPLFVQKALEQYKRYPSLEGVVFNLDLPPTNQGFGAQQFDMVIGSNILHASRDLDLALKHIRELLKPGGLLLAWETTQYTSWFASTFALIPPEISPTDVRKTQGSLLSALEWQKKLKEAGFVRVLAEPSGGGPVSRLGQSLILGQLAEEENKHSITGQGASRIHPFLKNQQGLATGQNLFCDEWYPATLRLIADYRPYGLANLPGGIIIEAVLAAYQKTAAGKNIVLENTTIEEPYIFYNQIPLPIQLIFDSPKAGLTDFQLFLAADSRSNAWRRCCYGRLEETALLAEEYLAIAIIDLQNRFKSQRDVSGFYDELSKRTKIQLGETLRCIRGLWVENNQAFAWIETPFEFQVGGSIAILIEQAAQSLWACKPGNALVVKGIERLRLLRPATGEMWLYATLTSAKQNESEGLDSCQGDVIIYNDAGMPALCIYGLLLGTLSPAGAIDSKLNQSVIAEQPATRQYTVTKLIRQVQDTSANQRTAVIAEYLCAEIARVLGLTSEELVDRKRGFFDMGMDSLMALQLKARVEAAIERSLPSTLAFDYPTVDTLARYLTKIILPKVDAIPTQPPVGIKPDIEKTSPVEKDRLEQLSEDELESLLAQRLADID